MSRLISWVFIIGLGLLGDCRSDDISPSQCNIVSYIVSTSIPWSYSFSYSGGKLVAITSGSTVQSFTYDNQGRLASTTYYGDFSPFTYTYTYDANNRVVSLDGQFPTLYTYNSGGQLIKQSNSDGAYTVFQYPDTITRNFSSVTKYDASDTLTSARTYEYDNKINPFYEFLYNYYTGQPDDIPHQII